MHQQDRRRYFPEKSRKEHRIRQGAILFLFLLAAVVGCAQDTPSASEVCESLDRLASGAEVSDRAREYAASLVEEVLSDEKDTPNEDTNNEPAAR